MEHLLAASALAQAAAVRAGEVSAVELIEATLRAAEDVQADLNPFTVIDADRALAAARTISAGDPRPFAGVPFATKDLLAADAGQPLTFGSRLFGDYRPGHAVPFEPDLRLLSTDPAVEGVVHEQVRQQW